MPSALVRAQALVIGEALTDVVVADGVETDHPGGSPFNVAITLGRLGNEVALLTALGDDIRGAEIAGRLDAAGVTLIPASRRRGATSTARAHLQPNGSAQYEFDIDWSLPSELDLASTAVTHSGSIAAFLEPGASTVAELLRERGARSLITLDPNIRPALVGAHAEALARVEALMQLVDLVKLSDEDAAWLYPDLAEAEVLGHLIQLGPRVAVMTRGGSGSLLATAADLVEVPAPPTIVADTIGAGDSYMGALIHLLLTSSFGERLRLGGAPDAEQLAAIGAFASRVAAITVSRNGADPPRIHELEG